MPLFSVGTLTLAFVEKFPINIHCKKTIIESSTRCSDPSLGSPIFPWGLHGGTGVFAAGLGRPQGGPLLAR